VKPVPAADDGPDVVVVGAGPVGLVAACELARHGLAVRVIDKLPAPTEESRAIVVHARSLEMFERMGVAGEAAGDHAPHVADAAVQDQMSAAWRPGFGGHIIVTVAAPGEAPEPVKDSGGARQVLITPATDREIDGYYAAIADPDHVVASRYGLRAGGRVIIRPDGYIGYIGDLDAAIPPYFSLLTG
jgi:choline dehydrogenase-like flavoprotein